MRGLRQVLLLNEMPELTLSLLDAYIPEHERTTTLLMGSIVTNPSDQPLLPCYGYNLTYNRTDTVGCSLFRHGFSRMDPGKGNALHRHAAVEIFVPLDQPFEFAYGSQGEHTVTLPEGNAIAVPAGGAPRREMCCWKE